MDGGKKLTGYEEVEDEIYPGIESLNAASCKVMYERYTLIAGILPFIGDIELRSYMIEKAAKENEVSKQTIRKYLCRYLANQNIISLALQERKKRKKPLSRDEKISDGL